MADYHEKVQQLMQERMTEVEKEKNGISGAVTNESDGILCLAVPYKNGYHLWIDGREEKIETVNKMYIGCLLKKGEKHSILLKYETPGLKMGVILTMIGMFFLFHWSKLTKSHCANNR